MVLVEKHDEGCEEAVEYHRDKYCPVDRAFDEP